MKVNAATAIEPSKFRAFVGFHLIATRCIICLWREREKPDLESWPQLFRVSYQSPTEKVAHTKEKVTASHRKKNHSKTRWVTRRCLSWKVADKKSCTFLIKSMYVAWSPHSLKSRPQRCVKALLLLIIQPTLPKVAIQKRFRLKRFRAQQTRYQSIFKSKSEDAKPTASRFLRWMVM